MCVCVCILCVNDRSYPNIIAALWMYMHVLIVNKYKDLLYAGPFNIVYFKVEQIMPAWPFLV